MSLFAPKVDHARVVASISAAEARTTGEIRVVVARHASKDPVASAKAYFEHQGMAASPGRNGVLIFVAPRSRNFAVIGDSAVHEKCGDAFWRDLADAMTGRFAAGRFTDGIIHGVERAGELLAAHFPRGAADGPAGSAVAETVD
ncbi:MAG TPA: TPM domain-containing protein [Opitutaceae bacterium]|jgi:uncharacterized membrane protein